MKPVFQENPTDCLRACLASLLEVSIEDVLEIPFDDEWLPVTNNWLREYHDMFLTNVEFRREEPISLPEFVYNDSYMIGVIESNLGYHAVITKNGKVVHDPIMGNREIDSSEIVSFDLLCRYFK
jgi:hypothetical protein